MADNCLQFSETLGNLTAKQVAWLQRQIEPIVVVNGKERPGNEEPGCDEPDYRGLRFLRDYEDLDDDADEPRFAVEFQGAGKTREAWLYAEDSGDPGRVAYLVQKFLKKFRPDECWSLTYATTCSQLRANAFGGGAVFVTANEIKWQSADDYVEQQWAAFEDTQAASFASDDGVSEIRRWVLYDLDCDALLGTRVYSGPDRLVDEREARRRAGLVGRPTVPFAAWQRLSCPRLVRRRPAQRAS